MARKSTTTRPVTTAWVGWVYFAAAMLLTVGALQIITGLVALFKDDFYVATQAGLVAFSYTTWGWISLVLGTLVLLTGAGVWAGKEWARIVAIFLAVLVMIENMAFISSYPLWSIISLVITGFVIYALTMHGTEVQE